MYISLSNDGPAKRKAGFLWRLQYGHVDARKTIRLGVWTKSDMSAIETHIRRLAAAKASGEHPHPDTIAWSRRLSEDLYKKLAMAELPKPRDATDLGAFLDSNIRVGIGVKGRPLKPEGLKKLRQARMYLGEFFGDHCRLNELTSTGAAEWYAWLLGDDKGRPESERRPIGTTVSGTPQLKRAFSLASVKTMAGYVKTFGELAVSRSLLRANPFSGLASGTTANDNDRIVTREEAVRVLSCIESPEIRLFFAWARFAAMRMPSEGLPCPGRTSIGRAPA